MRASFLRRLGFVALCVSTNACDQRLVACNLNLVYGLRVAVTDSISGTPLVGPETIVEVRDGSYVDTLMQGTATDYIGAGERPGTYSIKVQRPAYRVWQRGDIRVREDECHVIPVQVNVRLQPI